MTCFGRITDRWTTLRTCDARRRSAPTTSICTTHDATEPLSPHAAAIQTAGCTHVQVTDEGNYRWCSRCLRVAAKAARNAA